MQRLSSLRLKAISRPCSTVYTSPSIPIHLHLQAQSAIARSRMPNASSTTAKLASTSSAPKSAEGPSAQSGGSRSKDAAEAAEASGDKPSSSASSSAADPETAGIDSLSERDALGRTGGGKPLESSSENAPRPPKVNNASIPGDGQNKLSKEQKREVEQHNREFEERHDRASPASKDKVNKSFWSGGGTRRSPGTE
ncbi:uncharacterized protein PpBr36_06607 [Pyricularia pennisetigena]|uniref:uncharacterized protein n=1 Tax=Pyricularia pennisetigena TaxID=1578925 RepID=UPI00114DCB48|nr:uncharacterized protein PpBr36_06607 [Pyricularia pennisetigena]TLS23690.1 hypothetical protein PpBr36_06607 [Pyricularia pennisetigena]